MRRYQTFTSLACAAVAALTIGATAAYADPSPSHPNVLTFTVVCPGIAPFKATVVGPGTATNPQFGTQTVFLQLVQRG
jgi:hypothetical protein